VKLSILFSALFFLVLQATALKQGERIVFLGDSITQAGARGNGYVRQVDDAIQRQHPDYGVTVIGAGISGHKVPDCQKRLERDVLSKMPSVVVIYIGINDVWHWSRNRGTKKEDFDAGLRDMIAKIKAVNARVILCTPTVIGEKTDGSNKFDEMLEEYSAISRKVAAETDSQMLDLRKAFMDYLKANNPDNKDRGILTGDTVHLNAAGNTKVAELMLDALGVVAPTITLPRVFSNHMVLQRDKPIVVWGKAPAGAEVYLMLEADPASATATESGEWRATLPLRSASTQPATLTVTCNGDTRTITDILVGDVWVGSGQSNMEWPLTRTARGKEVIAAANHPHIRLFHVPKVQAKTPAEDIKAAWKTCTSANVPSFSAVLYHFGSRLHSDLEVPIGLINSSWGGSPIEPWTPSSGTNAGMYNAMIAPLANFAITGCIWYQGETNTIHKNGLSYADKMKALIDGWRGHWGAQMPFYFVQIAPWAGAKYEPGQLPALWEAQVATLKLPHTGMAVTTDIVHNINDIHPNNKTDVGNRLALWALAKTYGKDLVYSGPLFSGLSIEGEAARVSFAHAAGLKSRDDKPLSQFQVAGADGKFVDAKAEIDGETVVLSAEGVTPVQVRFAWHKVANPNLVNGAGLPASPFQSADWQGGTGE
jgi:sialate O-acetylesterase